MTGRILTVQELVEHLEQLAPEAITPDVVADVLGEWPLDVASLEPSIAFRDDRYARHLVSRSELFDVIVLCWEPGQSTPVHNHSGQLGWVRLVRGAIEETRWSFATGTSLPDLSICDVDEYGVGHGIELLRDEHVVVTEPGTVVGVDTEHAIHTLGNPSAEERTVTLHVYSRPHDSCLVFDPEERTCWRRTLVFDTQPAGAI